MNNMDSKQECGQLIGEQGARVWFSYWSHDVDPSFGKTRGAIRAVSTRAPESLDPPWSVTSTPFDRDLITSLLSGEATIDVDESTPTQLVTSSRKDTIRLRATRLLRDSTAHLRERGLLADSPTEDCLRRYVEEFKAEFTRVTGHIPLRTRLDLFPHALLEPSSAEVLVGRDGVGLILDEPRRPEAVQVVSDQDRVLDELIVPHLVGRGYDVVAPLHVFLTVCDDTRYRELRGRGHAWPTPLGAARFVIGERRLHEFYYDIRFVRTYIDGAVAGRQISYLEVFGDVSPGGFTPDRARSRARLYARLWAAQGLTRGNVAEPESIRDRISAFRRVVEDGSAPERAIEAALEHSPWLLERSLGVARFYSQVAIPSGLLSMSSSGIKPDKLLEGHDGYVDVLDIKLPRASLIVGRVNRERPSSELADAIAQVETYCEYLSEPRVREHLERLGMRVLSPRGVLLVGRRATSDPSIARRVLGRLSVRVVTYDDILDELEAIVSWIEPLIRIRSTLEGGPA